MCRRWVRDTVALHREEEKIDINLGIYWGVLLHGGYSTRRRTIYGQAHSARRCTRSGQVVSLLVYRANNVF